MAYTPDRGDIVWVDFNPVIGHEQGGHRPALVISPKAYNQVTGLMLCCLMTSRIKGFPFEVEITSEVKSVVLSDQLTCLDWRARAVQYKGRVSAAELAQVRAKLAVLV